MTNVTLFRLQMGRLSARLSSKPMESPRRERERIMSDQLDYEAVVAGLSLPSGTRPRIYMDYNDQILAPKSIYYLEQYLETYGEPIRYRTTNNSMDNIAGWLIKPATN